MTRASNVNGRAFEYACVLSLKDAIEQFGNVQVIQNSSLAASRNAFNEIQQSVKSNLTRGAKTVAYALIDYEPILKDEGPCITVLKIQKDSDGEVGDVRDIILSKESIDWEIGLSCKHNHFAVKHSRLSITLDFGKRWYGLPCSQKYWDDVAPIFQRLQDLERKGVRWCDLKDKEETVYVPLLRAFHDEVCRSAEQDGEVPARLVEYLLGKYDFYKVISLDKERRVDFQAVNLRGDLNRSSNKSDPAIRIALSCLPTRIIACELRPNTTNFVDLYLDNGWSFSFRIHSASKIVEPSLKFDIQFLGVPATITTNSHTWVS